MAAYYNEFDPKAAAWLRELIKDGLITEGEVDERSIVDVSASDLRGYSQHHFFAGIGGWSYALRLAGWADDVGVWTASLPCQPFSAAGKGLGKSDERHLLPHFLSLVRECKPSVIFGEQVSAAIKHGWLDDLYAEMEARDYAVGSTIIGAHSIGAPHIRQRLYWVADSNIKGLQGREGTERSDKFLVGQNSLVSGMGDTQHHGRIASEIKRGDGSSIQNCEARQDSTSQFEGTSSPSSISWIYCRDNKYRSIESSIFPLAHGIPRGMVYSGDPCESVNQTQEARAMRLKGYGNAIVPQLAAEFIRAFMDISNR